MAKNWAIVIGINNYEFLQPLQYATQDAEAMRNFLQNKMGFEHIFCFTDNSPRINGKSTKPFRENILRVLRQLFEQPFMGDGDNFWFFFSGHGIRYHDRDYLMPLGGDPENVENTGIATHDISDRLRRCGADNVVVILDACRNGGKKSGEGIGRQTEEIARQTGVISFFSCSPEQYSYEIEAIGQGAFTIALLEGLSVRGKCATVEQLNQYLKHRVPEITRQYLGPVRQVPYTIAEPIDRSHLILVPQYATLSNISTLKNHAYQAEADNDLALAERLWIRVLEAAAGQDMDAVRALQRVERLRMENSQPFQTHPPAQQAGDRARAPGSLPITNSINKRQFIRSTQTLPSFPVKKAAPLSRSIPWGWLVGIFVSYGSIGFTLLSINAPSWAWAWAWAGVVIMAWADVWDRADWDGGIWGGVTAIFMFGYAVIAWFIVTGGAQYTYGAESVATTGAIFGTAVASVARSLIGMMTSRRLLNSFSKLNTFLIFSGTSSIGLVLGLMLKNSLLK